MNSDLMEMPTILGLTSTMSIAMYVPQPLRISFPIKGTNSGLNYSRMTSPWWKVMQLPG
ncbi:unnamed protein product [Haemonchus placei]|uniref:Uncharacterized protein n=1 Tax=Haemonchus placei TaxID=6290 RepID=A0A3P7UKC8_HAEPC|nr:unnamed protein product [Haemonchus placei]